MFWWNLPYDDFITQCWLFSLYPSKICSSLHCGLPSFFWDFCYSGSTAGWRHQSLLIIFILFLKNLFILAFWASFFFLETSFLVESTLWWYHSFLISFIMSFKNLFIIAFCGFLSNYLSFSGSGIYSMMTSSVFVDNFHYVHQKSVHHCNVDFFLYFWDFSYSGIYCMRTTSVIVDYFHYIHQKSVHHCILGLFFFLRLQLLWNLPYDDVISRCNNFN